MATAKPTEVKGYFAALTTSKYMLLTTFRRTGEPVSTPVHVVAEGDVAFFRTWDVSGKGKRLRHTASVKVAPCRFRGHRLGDDLPAVAVVLDDEASRQAAAKLARAPPPARLADPVVPPSPGLDYPAVQASTPVIQRVPMARRGAEWGWPYVASLGALRRSHPPAARASRAARAAFS